MERGLYRRADAEITEHYTAAAVCARTPNAIICLLSALNIQDIGTQLPRQEWIAIPHKARAPRATSVRPIRVVRFSGASLCYGVENTTAVGQHRLGEAEASSATCWRATRPGRRIGGC